MQAMKKAIMAKSFSDRILQLLDQLDGFLFGLGSPEACVPSGVEAFRYPREAAFSVSLAAIGAALRAPWPPFSTNTAKTIFGFSAGAKPINQPSVTPS